MSLIREAKAALGTDVKVLPTRAVPGLHGRVLALGEMPPWACDSAYVKDPTIKQSLQGALDWLLHAPSGDERGFMVTDWLEATFGPGVKELAAPTCKCEPLGCDSLRAVRNYEPLESRCGACYDAGCYLTEGLCLRD